ncbi:DUF1330 domain-containing protein [Elioraea rosea]|uniref:DUF1330 domain-containing protein n=1 Tax=Elioraea rosea TaxID=2492390 RepID=UPI0011826CF8|nr:DUF1330 domain-containing protein [Elioraea rosea]
MNGARPGYAVAQLRPAALRDEVIAYLERIDATLAPFGGRYLIHGAAPEVLEGAWPSHLVVIAFPDIDAARAWYCSPAYRAIRSLRTAHIEGDVALLEGVEPGHRGIDILAATGARAPG